MPTVNLTVTPTSFALSSPAAVSVQVSCDSACGQIALQVDSQPWQTVSLDAKGAYSTTALPSLSAGAHTAQAFFLASGSYASASSSLVSFTVLGGSSASPAAKLSTYFLQSPISRSSKDIVLSNTGSAPLLITGISFYTPYYTESDDCGKSLAANSTCTIRVTSRTPANSYGVTNEYPARNDQLTITSNNPGGNLGVFVVPAGDATLVLGPAKVLRSNVAFPSTPIGGTTSETIALINGEPAGNCATSVTGSDFSVIETSAVNYAGTSSTYPLSQCLYKVSFTPGVAGTRTGALFFGTDGSYIPLTGVGSATAAPLAALSPSTVTLQDFAGSQTITLSNNASSTLGLQGITVSAGFAQTNNCGSSLAAQSSCTITITSTQPAIAQGIEGLLTVNDDAGVQAAQLVGIIDEVQQFGSWPINVSSQTVQLPFVGGMQTEGGANPGDFPVSLGGLAVPIATFLPQGTGQRSAMLSIPMPGGQAPGDTVPADFLLLGTGLPAAGSGPLLMGYSPIVVAVPVGQTVGSFFVVNNGGTTTFHISFGADEAMSGKNASDFVPPLLQPLSISPGQRSDFVFVFAPSGTGIRSANLVLTDASSGQSVELPVSQIGTPAAPTYSGAKVSAPIGSTGTYSLTVTSPGKDPVVAYMYPKGATNPGVFTLTKTECALGETPCLLTFTYSPTSDTISDLPLVIVDTVTGSAVQFGLGGGISSSTLALTRGSIDFGTERVNFTSPQYTDVLNSNGAAIFSYPAITGPNASDFTMSTTCITSLPDGGSCGFTLEFAPATAGNKTATLVVTSITGQVLTTTLTGVGQ